MEQDKLLFHPQAAAPPIFKNKTNPSHFICQEMLYKIDRDTKKRRRILCLLQSALWTFLHMSITNLILIVFNLFFSCPLPIKQTIKVEHRNISTPKTGIQDLVVKHYDCSPKHITYMQS